MPNKNKIPLPLIEYWFTTHQKVNYPPIVPQYKYPSKELLISLVQESNTLNRLDLVEWALNELGSDYSLIVNTERAFIRQVNAELPTSSDNVLYLGRTVCASVVPKAVILAIALHDGANRVRCGTPYGRRVKLSFGKLASYLLTQYFC